MPPHCQSEQLYEEQLGFAKGKKIKLFDYFPHARSVY